MAPSLSQVALGDLKHELANTRRYLERIPGERLSWRPHTKSMPIGSLGWHLANLLHWQVGIVEQDEFDLAKVPPPRTDVPADLQEILDHFDRGRAELLNRVDSAGNDALTRHWTLRRGDHVISKMPRAAALRSVGISHMIHHRGQLSVYLRLLDIPLPGIYGPTADEQWVSR